MKINKVLNPVNVCFLLNEGCLSGEDLTGEFENFSSRRDYSKKILHVLQDAAIVFGERIVFDCLMADRIITGLPESVAELLEKFSGNRGKEIIFIKFPWHKGGKWSNISCHGRIGLIDLTNKKNKELYDASIERLKMWSVKTSR